MELLTRGMGNQRIDSRYLILVGNLRGLFNVLLYLRLPGHLGLYYGNFLVVSVFTSLCVRRGRWALNCSMLILVTACLL